MKSACPILLACLLITLLAAAGCQATGQAFMPPAAIASDKAQVYIYRMMHYREIATEPDVCIDNKSIGKLPMDGYYLLPAKPGPITVSVTPNAATAPVTIEVKPAAATYIRIDAAVPGFVIQQIPEQDAVVELSKCRDARTNTEFKLCADH